jgi:predicted nuclease of restriction endonuclease-like (RecB) superfamily
MTTPQFIKRDSMLADTDYVQWLSDLKQRYRQSQAKAAVHVNHGMLEFYWSLGRDIVALKAESKWGSGIINQLSVDLQNLFPSQKGFSARNIWDIKKWYLFYSEQFIKLRQPVAENLETKLRQPVAEVEEANRQQPVDDLDMPTKFAFVPWGHHIKICTKCHSLQEAFFYINQVIEGNWSRGRLEDEIKADLFARQGGAITNFENTLPVHQQELAQEILKDPYNFAFLDIEKEHDEKQLEEALVSNITRFLLELGQGFSFVGRQMELQMPGGQTFYPDLIFYHIPQHRYVVVELKAVKYIPEFAGKLNFYVTAVDQLMKGEGDNPTVGLVICKSTDKTVVEWSLRDICKPLGVATYQLEEVVERTVREIEMGNQPTHQ